MAVSASNLVRDVRLTSGLRNNRLWSNEEILVALNDGIADLRDKLISKFAHWFRATHDFTLTSENGGNVLDLALVPLLEMVQGLDLLDSDGNPYTVNEIASFAERNRFSGTWPGTGGWGYNGFAGRGYMVDGESLFVLPAQNAGGDYRLIYTPMQADVATPVVVNITGTPSDFVQDQGGFIGFIFDNGDFIEDMEGGTIAVTWQTPNASWNGTYTIREVLSPTLLTVTIAWTGASFTPPPVGGAVVTYQPPGTVAALPQALTPWARYPVLYASRTIRTSRRQPVADLELQWEQMAARVSAVGKQRSEGVRQAPITRTGYGGGGGGWGTP